MSMCLGIFILRFFIIDISINIDHRFQYNMMFLIFLFLFRTKSKLWRFFPIEALFSIFGRFGNPTRSSQHFLLILFVVRLKIHWILMKNLILFFLNILRRDQFHPLCQKFYDFLRIFLWSVLELNDSIVLLFRNSHSEEDVITHILLSLLWLQNWYDFCLFLLSWTYTRHSFLLYKQNISFWFISAIPE